MQACHDNAMSGHVGTTKTFHLVTRHFQILKNTPFFLSYGMHPLTPVSASLPRLVPSAHDLAEGIEGAVRRAKQELQAAQNRMA